jgi:tetratricopeptide (TPR) repeat protein
VTETACRIGGGNHRSVRAPRRAPGGIGRAAAIVLVAAAAAFAALAAPAMRAAPPARKASAESCLACSRASDPLACHQVAVELATRQSYERAIAIEERVHERVPGNPEVAAALARMHQQGTKNSARAIALYHAALSASPGYPPALLGLGQIMEDAGELEIATRYLARGARERPEMAVFKVRLADLLIKTGRDGEAQPVLQEIVDRWPGSPEAESARKMMSRTALARP